MPKIQEFSNSQTVRPLERAPNLQHEVKCEMALKAYTGMGGREGTLVEKTYSTDVGTFTFKVLNTYSTTYDVLMGAIANRCEWARVEYDSILDYLKDANRVKP